MPIDTFSLEAARNLMVAAQGLALPPQRPAEKADVLAAIHRMGALQIDTIHVVARSPYLVLWSRLGDYDCAWLDELLAEAALFEYWSHAMCFLPVESYPLYRRFMLEGLRGADDGARWVGEHADLAGQVMARIRAEGGLRSADFAGDKPAGGWWNWKDEKTALECLFWMGELMIARRQNFQRIYDLRERVLPNWAAPDDARLPSKEEAYRALTLQAVAALGISLTDWVPDYFRLPKKGNLARLEALADEGRLQRVAIEGLPGPAYLHPQAAVPIEPPCLTTLLTPFDPLVWDRRRIKELYGFDYTIEVYTPANKRRFGYFTLPILHNGMLVGRLDPKVHRAQGLFEVRALALEPGVEPTDELVEGLASALRSLAAWHGAPELVIRRSEPDDLAGRLVRIGDN